MLDGGIILLIAVPSLAIIMWTYLAAKRESGRKQHQKKYLNDRIYRLGRYRNR
jgi:hypothetical protein